jgi:hypothetical protein
VFAAKFGEHFTGGSNPPRINVGESLAYGLECFLPFALRGRVFVLPEVEGLVQSQGRSAVGKLRLNETLKSAEVVAPVCGHGHSPRIVLFAESHSAA